jgi:cyclopropane-fatty-acyl-phospholipid synthase
MTEHARKFPLERLPKRGASEAAIQAHYDVGNEFYRLWLDESMSYSAAMWESDSEDLESAQRRKRRYHIDCSDAAGKTSVLDIGCGWGACLEDLVRYCGVHNAVGLTLSDAQVEWIKTNRDPKISVYKQGWEDYQSATPFDAIISIGAFEHFVKPDYSLEERMKIYRRFFEKSAELLKPGGRMSLQTQAYNLGRYIPQSPLSRIFPESDMPRLPDIVSAFDGLFEPIVIRNDPADYARTVREWLCNLQKNREQAIAEAGEPVYENFERFLSGGIKGYESSVFMLLRFTLRKV